MAVREIGVGLILGFVIQLAFGAAVFARSSHIDDHGFGFCNGG